MVKLVYTADLKSAAARLTGSSPVPGTTTPGTQLIIFELSCEQEHRFEGWFRSAEDYQSQQERGLVTCPHCNSHQIRKIPAGIHLAQGGEGAAPAAEAPPATVETSLSPLTAYRQVVDFLMSVSDDVGSAFAEEARKMHNEEAPRRSIRGQASDEEFAELEEEGIGVFRLPLPKKEDLN